MITNEKLNVKLLKAEYAVRGPIVQRAQELEAMGREIIYCNIGNPQALGQRPITCLRQLLCLLEYPALIDSREVRTGFPSDVVERAKSILVRHPHGLGAYSQSAGIPFVRKAVADFIAERDGIPTDPSRIILTDGASKGAQAVLTALLRSPGDGFLIPIPQYPLYSASLSLLGGESIGYYLGETEEWRLTGESLNESIDRARASGINPVGIVVINPGNPTGATLSRENMEGVLAFARRHELAVLADEVYQENVYASGAEFLSFAKVMYTIGDTTTPLFSLHSVSKGFLGECGHRGGYLELRNIPDDVLAQFIKLQSISLCANLPGQIATYFMVMPPKAGDESYVEYARERDSILSDLAEKAEILGRGVNRVPGMSVNIPKGAMYAFVRFELPDPPGVTPEDMPPVEREAYCA
ncbi:MAG: aminotransferase class I/II-fold pyridoxal phosphate-dependent enzyme, partial [Polyangia bacterium]|nr:aminotransferase class I/II-fold pyridoxal phosphate-dependent enzyme [Polyangia bacterium]